MQSHSELYWGLGLQHMNLGGQNSAHSTLPGLASTELKTLVYWDRRKRMSLLMTLFTEAGKVTLKLKTRGAHREAVTQMSQVRSAWGVEHQTSVNKETEGPARQPGGVSFLCFFPAWLTYDRHTTLCKFKTYNGMIWYTYTSRNLYHNKGS